MFERPRSGERAVLVHIELPHEADAEDRGEFRELVVSAGATSVAFVGGSRAAPDARLFVGRGKADEIRQQVADGQADVVIFNHALTPAQERNLEVDLRCRVLDRIGLILDIFAQRASSFEGKLQVELAQLRHLSTRLVRGWTHLERQKGGIGLRGPGEKQLETDRRLVAERIKQINRRLERVRKSRDLGRRARSRAEVAQVSLVGYTNAGKSTLFNALTDAGVLESGRLFATLDPTLRRCPLPDGTDAVLADTVGFIRHLPHDLVAAFRATLEETRKARLLLHVVDASAADARDKREQVQLVLAEIGAESVPQLEVYNKIDALEGAAPRLERAADGLPRRVWVSARTGAGLDLLREAVAEHVGAGMLHRRIRLPAGGAGRLRARFFELATVREEHAGENGEWIMDVDIRPASLERLCRQEGLDRTRIATCSGRT